MYNMSLDGRRDLKRNDEEVLYIEMRLVCDTVMSEVREIKTYIMKEVDDKFEKIMNLIKIYINLYFIVIVTIILF